MPGGEGASAHEAPERWLAVRVRPGSDREAVIAALFSVDNKTNDNTTGNYCDDPLEYTQKFKDDLSGDDISRIMKLEDHPTNRWPTQIDRIEKYWERTRTCFNIKVLPDELTKAGVSWNYYANKDQWMNGLQAIRHVRFGHSHWPKSWCLTALELSKDR